MTDRHELPEPLDRAEAAALLRAARTDVSPSRSETIGWAYAAMPDHKQARRLKIEDAIEQGDDATADAVLAQTLLVTPTDPTFARLRAGTLLARGETGRAEREIDLAVSQRPRHVATRLLAAEIAARRGLPATAVRHLEAAYDVRPWSARVRRRLAEAYLAVPDLAAARRLLAGPGPTDRTLEARLLMAEGRPRDALDRLEPGPRTPAAIALLLELYEAVGDRKTRRRLLESISPDDRALRGLLADGWLRLGALDRSVHVAFIARDDRDAVAAGMIAAALLGRERLARRFMSRLDRLPGPRDRSRLAARWGQGLATRLETPATAAAPPPSVLAELLAEATEVLDDGSPGGREHRLVAVDLLERNRPAPAKAA